MQKIRVVHFTTANTGGGVTKFVLRLWKYRDKDKFPFDFVTMNDHLDFTEQLEKEGAGNFIYPFMRRRTEHYLPKK